MHRIKKYANRKLYDTKTRQFITMDEIADLVKNGEEIIVVDNQTGKEITSSILSQLVSRNLSDEGKEVPKELLTDLLRKGSEGLLGSARKYVGMWQRVVTVAGDRIDKIEDLIDKKQDVSNIDEKHMEEVILRQDKEVRKWIEDRINEGIEQSLRKKNFATKKQIYSLKSDIKKVSEKIDMLQTIYKDLPGSIHKTEKNRRKP